MVRRFGKVPVEEEVRIARRSDPTVPSHGALRSLGGRRSGDLVAKLRQLAESAPAYADLLDILPEPAANHAAGEDISVAASATERDRTGLSRADG